MREDTRIKVDLCKNVFFLKILLLIVKFLKKVRQILLADVEDITMAVKRAVKWVQVDGNWTRMSVMTVGGEDAMDENENYAEKKARINVLMVPGNCGNEGFYEQLGREFLPLVQRKDREVCFYTVSHLNHVEVPKELHHLGKYPPHHCFTLEDQVQHKKDFCEAFLPKDGKLFIFSHSIGSYIALRLLPYLLENGWDVTMCYAMYPVIERMDETPNGRFLRPIANFMVRHDKIVKICTSWLNVTPMSVKRFLTRVGLLSWRVPPCVLNSTGEVFRTNVMRNIACITLDELKKIRDLDPLLIKYQDYITFYYGHNDAWTHDTAGEDMRKRVVNPERVIFDEHKCEHVIVIKDNKTIGQIMAKWVNSTIDPMLGTCLTMIPGRYRRRKRKRFANMML